MITGIGSFPLTDIDEAIDLIFSVCAEIPHWPQLPKRSPRENMYTTFLEGVPAVVVSEDGSSAYVDTGNVDGIETFYEDFFSGATAPFAVSERVAPGFYRCLERLGEIIQSVKYIKTQVTGPFSMGLGLKDSEDKPIIYNPSYFDIVKKALNAKARWMVEQIKARFPGKAVILFFDEPYLVSFGSAYVSISKEEVVGLIDEVLEGIDARTGIHCCGNTDWSVLFNTGVDIVNYDAYNFLDTIFYFEEDLKKFLSRGGVVAPGIVPSSDEALETLAGADVEHLVSRFRKTMEEKMGPGAMKDFIVTPSCGLGSLREDSARKAMEFLKALA